MRTLFTALALIVAAVPVAAASEIVYGEAVIVDGDTLEIDGRRIRLFGIDAPELAQGCERDGEVWACGEEARRQLDALVAAQVVNCRGNEVDVYGRLLAVCSVGYTEINRTMVEAGWATAFRRYSQDYVAAEVRARGELRGLWKSTFTLPEEYRTAVAEPRIEAAPQRSQRKPAAPQSFKSNGACLIKGNRNRKGEWIYHLPGGPYYDVTRAEEMFCTEEEAIAAGYRRSKA